MRPSHALLAFYMIRLCIGRLFRSDGLLRLSPAMHGEGSGTGGVEKAVLAPTWTFIQTGTRIQAILSLSEGSNEYSMRPIKGVSEIDILDYSTKYHIRRCCTACMRERDKHAGKFWV